MSALVFCFPDFSEPFILAPDASTKVLAVLMQKETGKHLLAAVYASFALLKAEQNYLVTDLEVRAVVYALTHFHDIIYGFSIEIHTDHQPFLHPFKDRIL